MRKKASNLKCKCRDFFGLIFKKSLHLKEKPSVSIDFMRERIYIKVECVLTISVDKLLVRARAAMV